MRNQIQPTEKVGARPVVFSTRTSGPGGPLGRFFRLSLSDQVLLIEAALLLATIPVGLRWLPYPRLQHLLLSTVGSGPRAGSRSDLERVSWAVSVAGRRLGWARCLPRALAAQVLLARRGHDGLIRIGLIPSATGGGLLAHAWLESGGSVVIGGTRHLNHYLVLPR